MSGRDLYALLMTCFFTSCRDGPGWRLHKARASSDLSDSRGPNQHVALAGSGLLLGDSGVEAVCPAAVATCGGGVDMVSHDVFVTKQVCLVEWHAQTGDGVGHAVLSTAYCCDRVQLSEDHGPGTQAP